MNTNETLKMQQEVLTSGCLSGLTNKEMDEYRAAIAYTINCVVEAERREQENKQD